MSIFATLKRSGAAARQRSPFLDHLIRMYGRYQADSGDRLAAAVTFYWFLSLFPILLLAISVLGYVYGSSAPRHVTSALSGYLPPQIVSTLGDTLVSAKGKAGVLGLVGLLLSGLGWVDGLREAIRSIWHQNVKAGNFVTRKLLDIFVLLGLFGTIAVSVVVTGATTAATGYVLSLLGLSATTAAKVFTQVLAYVLSGAADTLLFVYLFTRLPKVTSPIAQVLRSALFGAVGFEIVKFAGAFYVARTTSKGQATYGTFAVVVGLLLFLNLVSRLILLTAAFAVTAPYDSDALPSGTATREQARRAGMPTEYADLPQDPVLVQDGARTPLNDAVAGRPVRPPQVGAGSEAAATQAAAPAATQSPARSAVQDLAPAATQSPARSTVQDLAPAAAQQPAPTRGPVPAAASRDGAAAVRLAGRTVLAMSAAGVAAVGLHAWRTVRALRR